MTAKALHRMLRCWFDGLPGQKIVEAGFYVILDARQAGLTLPSQWADMVKPGAHIHMSMGVRTADQTLLVCPRCGGRTVFAAASSPNDGSSSWFVPKVRARGCADVAQPKVRRTIPERRWVLSQQIE